MKQQKQHNTERLKRSVPFLVEALAEETDRRRMEAKEAKQAQLIADRVDEGIADVGRRCAGLRGRSGLG
jgi:hypothetical protein